MRTIQCPATVTSDDPRGPAPRSRRRRAIWSVALAAVVVSAGVWALARPGAPPGSRSSPPPSGQLLSGQPLPLADRGYLTTLDELQRRAARAAAGHEPDATAVRDLLDWAAGAIDASPHPSELLQIDGTTGPFVDDTANAYGLALAWGVTGDRRYALAARRDVMAWATTTRELVNACSTGGECQTSLIVSRTAPGFVFALDLLTTSGAISAGDDAAFGDWLRTVILPAASQRANNWGDAGVFLRAVATDHLGDSAGWQAALDAWRAQLDLVARDGHIPEEVRRGSSGLSYTQEALLYKLAVARIAERRGIDLWSVVGSDGGTLRAAVDLAARYQANPKDWPYDNHVDVPSVGPGWELAYAHWPEPAIADLLRPVRPLGADGHSAVRWTTLTNGIELGG